MRSIDRASASTIVICIGILANIGGASSFFASPLGPWVKRNGSIVFWISILLSMLLLTFISSLQRRINNHHEEIASLKQASHDLEERSRIELLHQREEFESQLEEGGAQAHSLEREIERLNQLLYPSLRDKELFAEILEDLPKRKGVVAYLRDSFDAKQWFSRNVDTLYEFYEIHRESIFDNEDIGLALKGLIDASSAMLSWLSSEGALKDIDAQVYSIASAEERHGGYEAFRKSREKGFDLADKFLQARHDFELKGRALGL